MDVLRDKMGELWLYNHNAYLSEDKEYYLTEVHSIFEDVMKLDSDLFPYLKYGDEPIKVELWSKELWERTIDDIIHKFVTKQDSGNYACVNEIIKSITEEICG